MFMPETKTNRTEILVTYSDSQYYSHKNKQTLWNTIFLEQLTVTSWPIIPHISWNPNFHTSWSHPSPWIRMLQQVLLEPPTQRLPGFLPLRQVGWGVKLTTYHHLVMRLTNELYSYSYFLPSCCAQEQNCTVRRALIYGSLNNTVNSPQTNNTYQWKVRQ